MKFILYNITRYQQGLAVEKEGTLRQYIRRILLLGLSVFFVSNVFAQTHTVESTGEYVMGDNDTKIEARKLALEHAKRSALEQIGTYLESETVIKNDQLTKDEIKVYTSGIIQTTVLSEKITLLEDMTAVFRINIKATVDTSLLEMKIKEIGVDTKRKEQIDALQADNIKLLREIESLSAQLKSDNALTYRDLRQRRESLLEKLEKNQNSIRVAFEKGTLLNLALKNKDELEELKSYIDDALQFIVDNTVVTIGEPQVRYKGEYADLLINITWHIDKSNDLEKRFSLFCNDSFDNLPYLYLGAFKGLSANVLYEYYSSKDIQLKIEVGRWQEFVYIKDYAGIYLKGSKTLAIKDIPVDNLNDITSIDAKVIIK